jgi:hypothetical protein
MTFREELDAAVKRSSATLGTVVMEELFLPLRI